MPSSSAGCAHRPPSWCRSTLAAGRVCAADVLAVVDLPPFASSAMDGYAVRAADTPGALRLTGRSSAGTPATREVGPGEAIAISTGAVVPDGADAVVPIEQAVAAGETVEVEAVAAGDNVRPPGGDVRAGEVVVAAGTVLGAAQIGAAAAAGVAAIACGPRPRVAIVPTGSELRKPGEPLEPGQIYESNGALLAALCRSAGAEVTQHGAVADDEGETRALLEAALEADVLVTSGGVSMGVKDLVRSSLASLGAEEVFWRVAVRPGKPVAFAVRGATLVFGLPGNPVSSLVAFELFVRPALRALQGAEPGPVLPPGPARRPPAAGRGSRRSGPRGQPLRRRVRVARAALRPVVAHDRPGRGRRRARACAAGRGRPRARRGRCST